MTEDTLEKGEVFRCPHCGTIHPLVTSVCPETGQSVTQVHKFAGRRLENKYVIERIIGEGGMGVVYAGVQENIDRTVAIKFFNPQACTDKACMERFVDEAKYAASIGHANIIKVLNFGYFEEHVPYIVMEYLDGESLGQLLQKEKTLTAERAIGITCQILGALQAVHATNIIHRDLKPENIFLARQTGGNEIVKLLDFGISRIMKSEDLSRNLAESGRVYGTPYYVAPEQAEGKAEIDHRADIYSTGVLLYEMVTGQLPFRAKNYATLLVDILTKPPPNPKEIRSDIPSDLARAILRALEKKPKARFQSAKEMIREMERILAMLQGSSLPETSVPPPEPKRERRRTGGPRRRRISSTGYKILTVQEELTPDSPYLKAKRRRSSIPPASAVKKIELGPKEKEKLESASTEIKGILEKMEGSPPPVEVPPGETGKPGRKTPRPGRKTKKTPLALPAADDDAPEVEAGVNMDKIDKGWE